MEDDVLKVRSLPVTMKDSVDYVTIASRATYSKQYHNWIALLTWKRIITQIYNMSKYVNLLSCHLMTQNKLLALAQQPRAKIYPDF